MFGKEVYIQRRERLIREVENGIILLLGNEETPMNYRDNTYHFRQDSTFLYFFGIDSPGKAGILDADSGKVVLFGNDIDLEDIIWMGPQESVAATAIKVGITNTMPLGKLPDLISEAIQKGRRIHFLPPYRAENKVSLQKLTGIIIPRQKEYASAELIKAVVSLRSVKEPCEIDERKSMCHRVRYAFECYENGSARSAGAGNCRQVGRDSHFRRRLSVISHHPLPKWRHPSQS
jgi:Xaa-Pro aminopeptidase